MDNRIFFCKQYLTINLVTSFYLYAKVKNKLIRKLNKKIYKVININASSPHH